MSKRPETGAMQFEDDWRGVFIRGDNAFGYAMYLRALLSTETNEGAARFYRAGLQGPLELLLSSDERDNNPATQLMKPFQACVRSRGDK